MRRGPLSAFAILLGLILPVVASAETAFTNKLVNMRAGPDREFPAVMRLGEGTPVEVAGCIDDWTWCDVIAGSNRGWIYAGNLEYPYEGRRVPIVEYGADFGFPVVVFSVGPYWDTYYRGRPWYSRRHYWAGRPYHRSGIGVPAPRPGPGPRQRAVIHPRPGVRPHPQPRPVDRPGAYRPGPAPRTGGKDPKGMKSSPGSKGPKGRRN